MRVLLDPSDLKPMFQKVNSTGGIDQNILTGALTLDHFQEDVQDIVLAVGRAEFRPWNSNNSKVIKAPKRK